MTKSITTSIELTKHHSKSRLFYKNHTNITETIETNIMSRTAYSLTTCSS